MKLLEAIQTGWCKQLFCVGYAWQDAVLGMCENHTVVEAVNERRAMETLLGRHKHLTRVWIVTGEAN